MYACLCVLKCVCAGSRGISLTCVLTPCRVIGVCVTLMTLGAIGAAVWAVGQTAVLAHLHTFVSKVLTNIICYC